MSDDLRQRLITRLDDESGGLHLTPEMAVDAILHELKTIPGDDLLAGLEAQSGDLEQARFDLAQTKQRLQAYADLADALETLGWTPPGTCARGCR
ncbi:hypothetical protein [Nonomuraea typhae]|uniref:hypothetical protein n=1 Tax=Nonomuraea typhae TaxID=2603600 RepID=UPI0012FBB07F|nr:hypothetical protein [Nonomuraea typhae]